MNKTIRHQVDGKSVTSQVVYISRLEASVGADLLGLESIRLVNISRSRKFYCFVWEFILPYRLLLWRLRDGIVVFHFYDDNICVHRLQTDVGISELCNTLKLVKFTITAAIFFTITYKKVKFDNAVMILEKNLLQHSKNHLLAVLANFFCNFDYCLILSNDTNFFSFFMVLDCLQFELT